MPDFPIIDTHVHLYDPNRFRFSWLAGKLLPPHLLPEFDAMRGAVEVEGIVWVEVAADPGQHLEEARFVADLAATAPRLQGMVAAAPLEHGDGVRADLEQLAALPLVKGVRWLLQNEPDPAFCLRPGFIEGIKLLPDHGLFFDLCIFHHQLANVIELVRRCPEVRFILDHIAKPGIKAGLFDPWRTELAQLAAMPNVWCKISGVITEADHSAWTREQLRPYIRHVAESFGFDRTMFGSDWPVSEFTHRYPAWVEIVDWALADCSEAERRKLFRDNAIAAYNLDGSK
jgi:L-fuconolactonase